MEIIVVISNVIIIIYIIFIIFTYLVHDQNVRTNDISSAIFAIIRCNQCHSIFSQTKDISHVTIFDTEKEKFFDTEREKILLFPK